MLQNEQGVYFSFSPVQNKTDKYQNLITNVKTDKKYQNWWAVSKSG